MAVLRLLRAEAALLTGVMSILTRETTTALILSELLDGIAGAQILRGSPELVTSISYDSRAVEPGGMFVALRGSYFDGHDYLHAARAARATICMIDRDPSDLDLEGYAAVVTVPDSRRALASVARTFYGDPSRDLLLIGITGTDGKTTTSFMAEHLLERAGMRTGMVGTIATKIPGQPPRSSGRQTTPESLDTQRLLAEMRSAGADAVVLETSSHGLETHRVDGCKFDVGLITNITHEHLDFHGSMDAYRRAKARLFDLVSHAHESGAAGVAIVNGDDPGARSAIPHAKGVRLLRYGIECREGADVSATNIKPTNGGYKFSFSLGVRGERYDTTIPMIGSWNVSNALAAVAICYALGLPACRLQESLRDLPPVPGRMQPVRAGQPFQVVIDYAHTSPALRGVLESAREATAGKVLLVFGSAGERDIEKRAEMGAIAAQLSDYFVATSEDPRFEDPDAIIAEIASGAIRAGAREGVDFDRLEDRSMAIARVFECAEEGDTVVLAGKGHEQSMIYGAEALPWDEAAIAEDLLAAMGYSTNQ